MIFLYGLIQSILSTLIVRYISQGKDLMATAVVTLATYLNITAILIIMNTENPFWYLVGVAVGTYSAMKWDKEKLRQLDTKKRAVTEVTAQ